MNAEQDKKASRWWELYVVRYGMGTVVGAIIVYTMCSKNSVLNPLIFETKSGTLDANLLLLLVGYGITFCYVASAPILVLHTSRFANEHRIDVELYRVLPSPIA